jgi:hypothetical protein
MSINNVFGVSLKHNLYDVDELLLEEDPCNLQTTQKSFLFKDQLTAFVNASTIVSSPGNIYSNNNNQNQQQQVSHRDLEEGAIIQVPLWVARVLVPGRNAIMISPEKFNKRSLLDFEADAFLPLVAENKGQRYFDFGACISAFLTQEEAARVLGSVLNLYQKRYVSVLKEGLKKGSTGTRDSNLRSKLTTREHTLYNAVAQNVQWRNEWRRWLQ